MISSYLSAVAYRLFRRNCVWQTVATRGLPNVILGHAYLKKPRKRPLSKADKQHNRALARLRVRVEHVIRRFKIFRIFSGRYRNRRKRFGLRLNLIAGLLNFELAHAS